eukprot:6180211-Pyramimonas_sp.AAC.1
MEYSTFNWKIKAAQTEDILKTVDKELVSITDIIGKICTFVSASADEVIKAIERHEKKIAAAAEAKVRKDQQESLKKQREQEKEAKAQADRVKSSAGGCALLDVQHACIKPMNTFKDHAAYVEARDTHQTRPGTPFVIQSDSALKALCEERSTKATLGVFRVQYPASAQSKKEGRGFTPMHSDKTPNVLKQLQKLAPMSMEVPKGETETMIGKSNSQVLMYGSNIGNKAVYFQRQGLPTCSYQISGTKEVIAVDWHSLSDYTQRAGLMKGEKEDFFEWCVDIIKSIHLNEQLNIFDSCDGVFYKGTISAD